MKYLFSRGELRRRMEISNLWNNGELRLEKPEVPQEDEPFVEIQIITLKAYLESQAIDRALERGAVLANLAEKVERILVTELDTAKEFIEVTPNHIRVGINCELIDDIVISKVWDLLSRYDDLSPGTTIELGQLVQVYEKNKVRDEQRSH